jgi:phage-related protein
MEKKFDVQLLPEAVEFLNGMDDKAREKVYYNIRKSQFVADAAVFKKLNRHIWEFRTIYQGLAYRIFAFWDPTAARNTMVIATHGILKKSNKTPAKEIEKAENIRKHYLTQRQ